MPARNSIKQYVDNGYYHIYNRGVEKRLIFLDSQDYGVFLNYLKEYLSPKNEDELRQKLSDPLTTYKEKDKILKLLRLNNFANKLTLLAYCLMPNHFHLLVKQKTANTIDQFMQSLATRYSLYFNRKYKRVGSLFQSVYKAVLVTSEEQLLHLTRYIHTQALASQGETLQSWTLQSWQKQPCSYKEYLGERKTKWIQAEEILVYFSKSNPILSYQAFIQSKDDFASIRDLLLED